MLNKEKIISLLENPGVIAVVRGRSAEQIPGLAGALVNAGLIAVEITMTTPNAIAAIEKASAQFGEKALIGVGTVLDEKTCLEAIKAGAQFVVSPITRPEIARAARSMDKPVMLGAYTPTEAQLAHESGADYVKIFPADGLGPSYIKGLRAPLPHLKIVPTGGVDLTTMDAWFKSGCSAVGVGSSLISQKILQENDWSELESLARKFVEAARRAKAA